jgi:thioredoxin 1
MVSEDVEKNCPSCKKRDFTSFSKCRYCGTRYDAKIDSNQGMGIDQRFLLIVSAAVLIVGLGFYINNSLKEAKAKRLASIVSQIRAVHRPRIVELYADWCGPCKMYGPIVEQCRAKYIGQVDFQRFNVDEPNSRPIVMAIGETRIPTTCMFDSQGNQVDQVVGGLSAETLDEYVQKLLKASR